MKKHLFSAASPKTLASLRELPSCELTFFQKVLIAVITTVLLLSIMIILIVASLNWVPSNTVAFDYNIPLGTLDTSKLLTEGRYMLLQHQFITFPTTAIDITTPGLQVRSIEGLPIYLDVSLQYQIYPNDVPDSFRTLYNTFGLEYTTAITYFMQSAILSAASKHYSSEFFSNRDQIMIDAQIEIEHSLQGLPLNVTLFQIYNLVLESNYQDEI